MLDGRPTARSPRRRSRLLPIAAGGSHSTGGEARLADRLCSQGEQVGESMQERESQTEQGGEDRITFTLGSNFERTTPAQALGLGPLELQYQDLFSEVLEDGVITADERKRLDKVAANLGLSKDRLERLEEAMTTAYESHHRTRVVQQPAARHTSLSPLDGAPPLSSTASPSVPARPPGAQRPAPSEEVVRLRRENAELRAHLVSIQEELARAQASIHVEVDLASLDRTAIDVLDPEQAWRAVRQDPTDADALRRLQRSYQESANHDGAFLCAQALVVLGKANEQERSLAEAHRRRQLIAPARAFDETAWTHQLIHPEEERTTGAIFALVTPALLVGRVTTLRRDRQLRPPAPEKLQKVQVSTVMSVRAVGWGSALLGLTCPPIVVEPELDAEYVHTPFLPPYTTLGRRALQGREICELAFLVGQHLAFYRSERFVRTLFSATEDLEDLFLAALLIANPQLPLKGSKRARVEPLAQAIEPLLEAAQIDTLRGHYMRFSEEGGRTNLLRWSAATEKTAARVGLALCQDLPTACEHLARQEGPEGALALDLIPYATSERFLALRKNLQIGVGQESSSS